MDVFQEYKNVLTTAQARGEEDHFFPPNPSPETLTQISNF